mmetsp:Transcript_7681/g.17592  ORF Transcript_7681/g.17592 Transcript_7681/m.17592 type:complete len:281 (+) Transcript_7681:850-1692(+)
MNGKALRYALPSGLPQCEPGVVTPPMRGLRAKPGEMWKLWLGGIGSPESGGDEPASRDGASRTFLRFFMGRLDGVPAGGCGGVAAAASTSSGPLGLGVIAALPPPPPPAPPTPSTGDRFEWADDGRPARRPPSSSSPASPLRAAREPGRNGLLPAARDTPRGEGLAGPRRRPRPGRHGCGPRPLLPGVSPESHPVHPSPLHQLVHCVARVGGGRPEAVVRPLTRRAAVVAVVPPVAHHGARVTEHPPPVVCGGTGAGVPPGRGRRPQPLCRRRPLRSSSP